MLISLVSIFLSKFQEVDSLTKFQVWSNVMFCNNYFLQIYTGIYLFQFDLLFYNPLLIYIYFTILLFIVTQEFLHPTQFYFI